MKKEEVEIYSDTSNYAVMKHPDREYPGSLVQGDTLYSLCKIADRISERIEEKDLNKAQEEVEELREMLWARLNHYKKVLGELEIELPFYEG